MRTVIPWAFCGLLVLGVALQWRSTEEARSQVAALQSAVEETGTLYLELGEQYARWLTIGLHELRAGHPEEGFRALDTLLATTARTLRPGTPELEEAEAYLNLGEHLKCGHT